MKSSASVVLSLLFAAPLPALAATYHVDSSTGNDANSGTSTSDPLASAAGVGDLPLGPGDSVLFRRGQTFDGALSIAASGNETQRIVVGAWGEGEPPVLRQITVGGDFVTVQDLIVDQQKGSSDAIRIRGARSAVIRNVEARNGTREGIDAADADGLLIENVEIHHFLNGSFGSGDDAHGIAVTGTDGITIRGADIHHVSGDSLQSDPNRAPGNISDNILIEDSVLWTAPLEEDFNAGWSAGDSPGENAIDTKVLQANFADEIRMRITLKNVTAFGWTAVPEISNRAAFNLKEKIEATLDRITVYDSEIAFRVRGALGNADTTIQNAVIYDVDKAIRAEDSLSNLRVYNSTFGDGIVEPLELAGGSGGGVVDTWDWRNNAFVGGKPNEAADATNTVASSGDFVNAGGRDYHLTASATLIDGGVEIAGVEVDRDGVPRAGAYDVGAYELSGGNGVVKPMPPVLSVE